jgi:hypothetical protein
LLPPPQSRCCRGTIPTIARAIASAISIGEVTAKEKVLERAPQWSEEQAERALRAAEGGVDEWGDIRAQTQALAEQADERLKARERAAGETW